MDEAMILGNPFIDRRLCVENYFWKLPLAPLSSP